MADNNERANVEVNINGKQANETLKTIRGEIRAMSAEWDKMTVGTKEWLDQQDKIKAKKQLYSDLTREVRGTSNAMSELKKQLDDSWFGKVRSGFLAITGVIAGAAGAFKLVKDAFQTTDALADKWEETMTAAKEGYQAFLRTIATGDWSNFLSNITKAIAAGRDYARALDEIQERQRGLNIISAEARVKINDLIRTMKDQRLSDKERGAAAAEALKIETDLMQKKQSIASKQLQADLDIAATGKDISTASLAQYVKMRDSNNELIKQSERYLDLRKEQAELSEKIMKTRGGASPFDAAELERINSELNKINTTVKVYATEVVEKAGKVSDEQLQKIGDSYANLYNVSNDFKEGTRRLWSQYTGFLASENKKQEKDFQDSLKAKQRLAEAAMEKLKKDSTQLAEEYQKIMLTGDDTITAEALKNAEATHKFRVKQGIATADEILAYEMAAVMRSKEFAESSAEEQAKIIANTYKEAMAIVAKHAAPQSTTVAGENMDETFNPGYDPSSQGTPSNITPVSDLGGDLVAWGQKAQAVISYASTVRDMYGEINQLIADSENEQLAKDEAANEKKKDNLKRQLDRKLITEKQYNSSVAKLDAELDKEKRKIAHEQAKREKEMRLISALINTAAGMTSAFVNPGGVAGIILAAAIGLLGGYQVIKIANTPVPQAAAGKYDVIGADDGNRYSATWGGKAKTGIYHSPTLIAEAGPELVVDAATTRNIQMNYPWVIDSIQHARVRQFAAGNYTGLSGVSDTGMDQVSRISNTLDRLDRYGVKAYVVYDDVRNASNTVNAIESDVNS